MSEADQLKALRVRIDSLDEKILELISDRAAVLRMWRGITDCHREAETAKAHRG